MVSTIICCSCYFFLDIKLPQFSMSRNFILEESKKLQGGIYSAKEIIIETTNQSFFLLRTFCVS